MTKTKKKTIYTECKQRECGTPYGINDTKLPSHYYGDFTCTDVEIKASGPHTGPAWKDTAFSTTCAVGYCYLSVSNTEYCYQSGL